MQPTFEIEHNIPIPPLDKRGTRPVTYKYPFHLLNPGDSFVADDTTAIRNHATTWSNRLNATFTVRKCTDQLHKIRIWRVS